jgi:hypothetical protein
VKAVWVPTQKESGFYAMGIFKWKTLIMVKTRKYPKTPDYSAIIKTTGKLAELHLHFKLYYNTISIKQLILKYL